MSLSDTSKAIGAVTRAVRDHLLHTPTVTAASVTVGKPEPPANAPAGSRLNLFLYEIDLDPNLRNVQLDENAPPPIWLVLKYLLTAFDEAGESDSIEAHEFLGEGMRALQELSYLPLSGLTAATLKALIDNPESLKITFDASTIDLLSKLMQGSEEKYRVSAAFQVRPILIATAEAPSSSLLVGVDYTDNTIIGDAGVQIDVFPYGGPEITSLAPAKFEPGDTLVLTGTGLDAPLLSVQFGPITLAATAQSAAMLRCAVSGMAAAGAVISAGDYPVAVVQMLPAGRPRKSNLLIGSLLPVLGGAAPSGLTRVHPADPASPVYGNIALTGVLLGAAGDDVTLALYRQGAAAGYFDTFVHTSPAGAPQTQMSLIMTAAQAVPPGTYRVILRVNGQQAKKSPEVTLAIP